MSSCKIFTSGVFMWNTDIETLLSSKKEKGRVYVFFIKFLSLNFLKLSLDENLKLHYFPKNVILI